MIEDEKFYAWLDGELPAEEATKIEAEVAANPHLSRLAKEHLAMTSGLRNAFAQVAAQPVPQRLQNRIDWSEDKVVSLAEARELRSVRKTSSLWIQMSALAATLVVGIVTGSMIRGSQYDGLSSPIGTEAGRLVASGELENALSVRLASMPDESGTRIGLTFRDRSGAICRTFEDHAASGLACREGGNWRIRSLFQSPEGQATDYRMAAGPNPQLMDAVEAAIAGEPFDAEQEKAVMEQGWR